MFTHNYLRNFIDLSKCIKVRKECFKKLKDGMYKFLVLSYYIGPSFFVSEEKLANK